MHRLRRVRAGMPGRGHRAGHRRPRGEVDGAEPRLRGAVAQPDPQEGRAARRRRHEGRGRQVRQVLLSEGRRLSGVGTIAAHGILLPPCKNDRSAIGGQRQNPDGCPRVAFVTRP
ncbi:protein of unknown function [Azospirillum baldaniorum]|uniref:Uncharacterized protein n=1 Tax=Azospirillum baldaniorum TaxID=1064539 RepID=A0A9P1JMX9_9PROT|nr:protein of unknown function [Azospirillum baldaniorum]